MTIDNVNVEVRRSRRRRHVDVTIDRDGSVVVSVPERLDERQIEKLVRSRMVTLQTHLARKREVLSHQPTKQYVTGEGFYYLGRKYRLKLIDGEPGDALRLLNGRFVLPRSLVPQGHEQFMNWYTIHGEQWLADRVASLCQRVAVFPVSTKVRDLGFRWGSCTKAGNVNFHWRVILLPPPRIDYLILHELCHLHEHNHSPAFYERLERACPSFREHEAWLEENGDRFTF